MVEVAKHPVYQLDKCLRDLLVEWRNRLGATPAEKWEKSWVGLLGRLVPLLKTIDPEYAFSEQLAVPLYGGTAWSHDMVVLLTAEAWNRIQQTPWEGLRLYPDTNDRGGLSFVDVPYRAGVHVLPAVVAASEVRYGLRVAPLAHLIVPRLRHPVQDHRKEVTTLIRANRLDETFLPHLPDDTHPAFRACLQAAGPRKRR